MWAIIGGSGFENFKEFEVLEELTVETPYGKHSTSFKKVKWKNQECLFLSRHGEGHELLPSEINYQANIYALKKMGAKGVLSFSAIGSLKEELEPEHMVFVNQYIDFTKQRKGSFCGKGSIGHYSFAHPVEDDLVKEVKEICKGIEFKAHFGKTYVCVEGPRFSSFAESMMFKSWGAEVIGMTNMPEAYLAREAGLTYLPFCFVTDYDCWKADEDPVTVEVVVGRMAKNYESAREILNLFTPKDLYSKFPVPNINTAIFAGKPVEWLG